jgi:hypothetical protein
MEQGCQTMRDPLAAAPEQTHQAIEARSALALARMDRAMAVLVVSAEDRSDPVTLHLEVGHQDSPVGARAR